ncbi:uncharacterized protein LOC107633755 [Arachis ipaensis]|uniref:uncharacterized protein LOC107633755 n=1 Tax=Arachis ipaensis TaxID=130454 RepID=UPI0007AFA055|nr:uncharacterized protein LOC107633755 [Arachis ipaensis]
MEKLFYKIPISVLRDDVKYDSFVISNDEDISAGDCTEPDLVASPSFAVNLNRSCDALVGEAGPLGDGDFAAPSSPPCVPVFGVVGAPDGVEDALQDDDDDDDVEPATIADDSEEETPRTTLPVGGRASSSGTNQYPLPTSLLCTWMPWLLRRIPLYLLALGQGTHKMQETYSIRRGVEYKALESDHRKYYGKCKEFGNGCVWLIRASLRQRKGIWKVKRYNGPHTCLATSISSDHGKLDYHVISAFIMPLIRADAATSIKVLQNAMEAHFGFRLTYRRI